MREIKLSESEMNICKYIGTMRNAITSAQGTEMKQDQSKDSLQMSIDGVITEYACAKDLNLHFNYDCTYRKFGADLISKNGKSVDVKSTKPGGNLNAVLWSVNKQTELYILTELSDNIVRLVGWIDGSVFITDKNIKDVGNGSFYSLSRDRLHPFN